MNRHLSTLSKLADLRERQTEQVKQRVRYQRSLCQRYRNNIQSLERLIGYRVAATTNLQRDNQHNYKLTLYKMLDLQAKELGVAETTLTHLETELLACAKSEQVLNHFIRHKLEQWQQLLTQQEQKMQDGIAQQSWWQNKISHS